MLTENEIVKILGAVLILIYAFERFNTPPSNRAMTTAARYYTAASAYLLIYLVAYFLLCNYQDLLNLLLRVLNRNEFDKSWPAEVVGAILLSSILPKIPGFSTGDQKLRKLFQNLAAIPIEALRLSHEMYEAPYSVPVETRQKVRDHLVGLGFDEGDVVFEQEDSARFLWLKNTALLIELKDWKDDANFSEFFNERNEQFKRLIERYDRLAAIAQNCFNMVREMNSRDTRDHMEQSVSKFCANFREQANDLLREICQFTSQGILKCRLTHGSRCRKIQDMGFHHRDGALVSSFSIHQVLLLYGALAVLLATNFIFLYPTSWEGREKTLVMVTLIVSVYLSAAWLTILLKDKLQDFQRKPGQVPPVGIYLVSGVVSVAAGVLISLFFKTLIFSKGPSGLSEAVILAWQDFSTQKYPWMFMAFMTAIIISALSDYPPPERVSTKIWRFVEAAIMGSLLGAAGLFVHWWLEDICAPGTDLPKTTAIFVVSAVVGLVLGFWVPSWYRNSKLK